MANPTSRTVAAMVVAEDEAVHPMAIVEGTTRPPQHINTAPSRPSPSNLMLRSTRLLILRLEGILNNNLRSTEPSSSGMPAKGLRMSHSPRARLLYSRRITTPTTHRRCITTSSSHTTASNNMRTLRLPSTAKATSRHLRTRAPQPSSGVAINPPQTSSDAAAADITTAADPRRWVLPSGWVSKPETMQVTMLQ